MQDLISKELLSEVFTDNQQYFKINKIEKNIVYYSWLKEEFFGDGDINCKWVDVKINIYELAHKCKEWALKNRYIINSGATTSNDWCSTIYKVTKENPYIKELSYTWEQTESQAIFKACEWILDNKDLK